MEKSNSYSLIPSTQENNFSDIYDWWDCNDYGKSSKKRKKKKAKKRKKKKKKQAKRDFRYRMLEKATDITLHTMSDIAKMYAANKFQSSN